MKNKKFVMTISSVLATVVLATGCAQKTEEKKEENKSGDNKITLTYDQLRSRENTMGSLWYQNAAEVDALYQQGYNVATNKLKELLKQPTDKPYSIVLDIDETVLSNIPFQAKMVKDGTAFNPKLWDEWVQKAEATPVAGAKEFLQFADKNKVQIYYISDRTDAQVDATIKNLEAQGLPVQGRDHLMFKKEGDKSKEGRRQEGLGHLCESRCGHSRFDQSLALDRRQTHRKRRAHQGFRMDAYLRGPSSECGCQHRGR